MAITLNLSDVVDQRFALYRAISGKPKFRTALSLAALDCVTTSDVHFADVGSAVISDWGPFTRIVAEVFDPRSQSTTTVCVFPCHDVSLNFCEECTFEKDCEHVIAALIAVICQKTHTDPVELLEAFDMTIPTTWPKVNRSRSNSGISGDHIEHTDNIPSSDLLSFDDDAVAADPVSQLLDSFPHNSLRDLINQATVEIPEFARWLDEKATIALGSDSDIAAMLNTKVKSFKTLFKNYHSEDQRLLNALNELLSIIEEHTNLGRGKAVVKQTRNLLEFLDSAYVDEFKPHMQRLISLYIRLVKDTKVRPINLAKWLLKQQLANTFGTQLLISDFLPLFNEAAITHYESSLQTSLSEAEENYEYFSFFSPAIPLLVELKKAQGDWQSALELLLAHGEGSKALELVFKAPVSLEQQTRWLITIKDLADETLLRVSQISDSYHIFYNLISTNQLAAAELYLRTYYAVFPSPECLFNLMVLNELQSGALNDDIHTLVNDTFNHFGLPSGVHQVIYTHHDPAAFNAFMADVENYGLEPDVWTQVLCRLTILNPTLAAEIAARQAWMHLDNTGESAYYGAAKVLSRILIASEFHSQTVRQEISSYINQEVEEMKSRYSARRRMHAIFAETFAKFGF
ncbi:MAG: hypothetical protein Q4D85_00215 [Corynebacterium sp.]|uniref:hypothetical protein n=1 Tax=Corynebacterium sp. TaxID=1720 RepID=UPI0026DCCA78|nr:hypothetical protein [Corynebacterium sp.]MDO5097150.1 hypothetical protein [Corynebacterium sp.]